MFSDETMMCDNLLKLIAAYAKPIAKIAACVHHSALCSTSMASVDRPTPINNLPTNHPTGDHKASDGAYKLRIRIQFGSPYAKPSSANPVASSKNKICKDQ